MATPSPKMPSDPKRSPQRAAAELAAKKAASSKFNKYKSPGTNGFDGTAGFNKNGPWG
jgi:hypothetical protein